MGVKRPEMGSKWRFIGESATWLITAQLLFQHAAKSRVALNESQHRNSRKSIYYSNLSRKLSAPNFCQKPENVACRSMLTPAVWGMPYPARRAASTADPDDREAWGVGREYSDQ